MGFCVCFVACVCARASVSVAQHAAMHFLNIAHLRISIFVYVYICIYSQHHNNVTKFKVVCK